LGYIKAARFGELGSGPAACGCGGGYARLVSRRSSHEMRATSADHLRSGILAVDPHPSLTWGAPYLGPTRCRWRAAYTGPARLRAAIAGKVHAAGAPEPDEVSRVDPVACKEPKSTRLRVGTASEHFPVPRQGTVSRGRPGVRTCERSKTGRIARASMSSESECSICSAVPSRGGPAPAPIFRDRLRSVRHAC
jgi:hypothetical protein